MTGPWFVVQRDHGTLTGLGKVIYAGLDEDCASQIARSMVPMGFRYCETDPGEWRSSRSPLPGMCVRYDTQSCQEFQSALELWRLNDAILKFDAVFGKEDP